jgi:hypothetical protein
MSEELGAFDPGPAFRDDVSRARARVVAMTPDAVKAVLLELVEMMPGLVLDFEDCRSPVLAYRHTIKRHNFFDEGNRNGHQQS